MFYSHEVLTSRKYGVATVWLVATLGSKSALKKINRKAILDVDVPRACQTIQAPEAPMALRLQSNLLYGVSRVYLQQCGYILSDAQNAYNSMRTVLKVTKNADLDPDAGRARPEQLVLEDDPSFLPDFAFPGLDFDLSSLEMTFARNPQRSSSLSLTPHGSQYLRSERPYGGPVGGLILPTSDAGGYEDIGGFVVQGDDGRGTSRFGRASSILEREDHDLLPEADFSFDADGNLVEFTPGKSIGATPAPGGRPALGSDTAASDRVRREHEEGHNAGVNLGSEQMDLDMLILGDDFDLLPEGEAFPPAAHSTAAGQRTSSTQVEELEASSSAAAPMRRKRRAPRVIPLDQTMELRNSDLSHWNTKYLQNMAEATQVKMQHKAVSLAKKNAEFWIWKSGIGAIGRRLGVTDFKSPLDMFYGDALFESLTGFSRAPTAGQKHDRDSGINETAESETRRVRHRSDRYHVGRGAGMDMDGVIVAPMGYGDVEMPRDAPSALDDENLFSAMPWNITASIRGSSVARGRIGLPSGALNSVGGPSSAGLPGSLGRRRSRMVSASPLHGRGQAGGVEALRSLEGEDEFGLLDGEDFGDLGPAGGAEDNATFHPERRPTQTSQRVCDALDAEGVNFLAFVEDGMQDRRKRLEEELAEDFLQADAAGNIDEVLFEELLPPAHNTRVVAAQALMHTLALATKGLLMVRQDEHFGEIGLRFVQVGGVQVEA